MTSIMDPVHGFVDLNDIEVSIINSRPMQRLRGVHQLSFAYMIYPGATHKRFEHSIGVLEVADQIFKSITASDHCMDENPVTDEPPPSAIVPRGQDLEYWHQIVRIAALTHDMGHLPFSHTLEELLPYSLDHEYFTAKYINSQYIRPLLKPLMDQYDRALNTIVKDIIKIAVGPECNEFMKSDYPTGSSFSWDSFTFNQWEHILSQVIVGDVFGADRIDYLVRDARHTGVSSGNLDSERLVDSLRLLPSLDDGKTRLGIDYGGRHSAEELLVNRYFMHKKIYYHRTVLAYDHVMRSFLRKHPDFLNEDNTYPIDLDRHLEIRDGTLMEAVHKAARTLDHPANTQAVCMRDRLHPKTIAKGEVAKQTWQELLEEYGKQIKAVANYEGVVKYDERDVIPVYDNGSLKALEEASNLIEELPVIKAQFLYLWRSEHIPEKLSSLYKQVKTTINNKKAANEL